MSFNGSGSFSLYSPGNPVVTGTTISSTWANNTLSDIATGLSTCLLKNGTQTVTANLPMSSFKLTGLAAGTTAGDSLRYEQLVGAYLPITGGTLTGNLLFTDATYDIGASGATRPRNIFLSGAITAATAAGGIVATQAQQETGTAVDVLVSPGRQQFHPSAGKFWARVTVSGAVPTLQESYNVTSITDDGVGLTTVTIATDFSSAGWVPVATTYRTAAGALGFQISALAAGTTQLRAIDSTTGNATDSYDGFFICGFGDQ